MKHLPVIKFRLIALCVIRVRLTFLGPRICSGEGIISRTGASRLRFDSGRIAICVKHDFYATSFRAGVEK